MLLLVPNQNAPRKSTIAMTGTCIVARVPFGGNLHIFTCSGRGAVSVCIKLMRAVSWIFLHRRSALPWQIGATLSALMRRAAGTLFQKASA